MPCTLVPNDFTCVRSSVYRQLQGLAANQPIGDLFLTVDNLHYIFCEYVRRVETETGFALDCDTYSLDAYSRLIFELYWDGMCKYMASNYPPPGPTRLQVAQMVNEWTQASINALVFAALKEYRKKANYLSRLRDPLYGKSIWNPLHIAKPSASRLENSYRFNFTQIGATNYRYPVIDD